MAIRLPAPIMTKTELRSRWKAKAAAYGWAFPADWHAPAVDAVCEAIVADADVWAPAERLGHSRAAAGVSLAEALADVDGLATEIHGRYTDPLRRAVSLGWADRITAPPSTVADPLTGLVTPDYLRARLGETYRKGAADGVFVSTAAALVVVRLDLNGHTGWQRNLPMVLVADALRQVFDSGQSLALLGEAMAVVLCEREPMLARRARLCCSLAANLIALDPQVSVPEPAVWIEPLPPRYDAALDLLADLGR